jgi:lysozyme family protein
MADFLPAYERMIRNEGGYVLHEVAGDRGGQTYAGIARNAWPRWQGWAHVDRNEIPPTPLVREFYRQQFWDQVKGDDISHQRVAETLFDFAVNGGFRTAIRLAQIVVGTTPDGVMGPITVSAVNAQDEDAFMARYTIAKIARYAEIVNRDRSQAKFLLGWINRTLREAS